MKKQRHVLFLLMSTFLLLLVACSDKTSENDGDSKASGKNDDNDKVYSVDDFNQIKDNQGDKMDGGTLTEGLVSDSGFPGVLSPLFYSEIIDGEVMGWFDESLLEIDENYEYTQDGAATYEMADDGKTFTFTIRDNVNWQDGEPVTAEDWKFAIEVLGDPDYEGTRYGPWVSNLEGAKRYHDGEADSISGMEVLGDKKLKMTFKEVTPSLLTGGIWDAPMPKHIFEDMDIEDMADSPEVREHPIGFGPYTLDSIVPGESATYVKNEDYWRGEPALDKVVLKVIDPSIITKSLEVGEVDIVNGFPSNLYPENADMSNVEFLADTPPSYSYIGFKLGTWDKEAGEVKPDPDMKMADVELRKAMWHAVNSDRAGEKFYHGLSEGATTLVPPSHPDYHDDDNKGLEYDPEKANQILDDAGYEWPEGEDFRTDPDGNELTINYLAMSGGDTAEPFAKYFQQSWQEIGLDVELFDGRLHEMNSFYDYVGLDDGNDDPDVDVFDASWNIGTDIDPNIFYGREAMYNLSRYASEENDRLLEEATSTEALDDEYREKVIDEWQQLMVDEVPVFPTLYSLDLAAVNNRVLNYALGNGTGVYLYELAVSQEEPFVDGEDE